MLWFGKKKKENVKELERVVTIKVEQAKEASAREVARNKRVMSKFNKIINQNNFTIRVHSAAGGKH